MHHGHCCFKGINKGISSMLSDLCKFAVMHFHGHS